MNELSALPKMPIAEVRNGAGTVVLSKLHEMQRCLTRCVLCKESNVAMATIEKHGEDPQGICIDHKDALSQSVLPEEIKEAMYARLHPSS